MPSEITLQKKQALVDELVAKLSNSVSGVVVDYKGISVADDTVLRRKLREAGASYAVVKNTLLHRAAEKTGLSDLDSVLEGTTAIAISETDYTAAAKILSEYADKNKNFTIKAGYVDGKVIDAKGVGELAAMPSKEVLIAKMLGGFNAPVSGFANVLSANLRGLVVALNAIAEKQGA